MEYALRDFSQGICEVTEGDSSRTERRTYRTIVIDPPWRLPKTGLAKTRGFKNAVDVYPTMTVDQIAALPVLGLAAPNSHLWLWATDQSLEWALDLIKGASGAIARFTGTKAAARAITIRDQFEFLLFAYRGKMQVNNRYVGNRIAAGRGRHSTKPRAAYYVINNISTGPFLNSLLAQVLSSTISARAGSFGAMR